MVRWKIGGPFFSDEEEASLIFDNLIGSMYGMSMNIYHKNKSTICRRLIMFDVLHTIHGSYENPSSFDFFKEQLTPPKVDKIWKLNMHVPSGFFCRPFFQTRFFSGCHSSSFGRKL